MKKLNLKFWIICLFAILINCVSAYGLHKLTVDVHGGTFEFGEIDEDDVIVPYYKWNCGNTDIKHIKSLGSLKERNLIYCKDDIEFEKILGLACKLSELDSKIYSVTENAYSSGFSLKDREQLKFFEIEFSKLQKSFFTLLASIFVGTNLI